MKPSNAPKTRTNAFSSKLVVSVLFMDKTDAKLLITITQQENIKNPLKVNHFERCNLNNPPSYSNDN